MRPQCFIQISLSLSPSPSHRMSLLLLTISLFQVSLTQARIDMSELDEDSDGFLQRHVRTHCKLPSFFESISCIIFQYDITDI